MIPVVSRQSYHRRVTTSGSFTPTSITGLRVWYDPSNFGLTDGASITTATDSSGNGNNGTGGTAKPVYKTGIANSLPVMRFTGANGSYISLPNCLASMTAGFVFMVIKLVNDPPLTAANTGLWQMGTDTGGNHFPYTDGTIYDAFGSTVRKSTVNPTTSLSSAFRLYEVGTSSSAWTSWLNGTQLYTTATNTVGFRTAPKLGTGDGSNYFMDGDVAEFGIYDSFIGSTDRASLESYLSTKYALGF